MVSWVTWMVNLPLADFYVNNFYDKYTQQKHQHFSFDFSFSRFQDIHPSVHYWQRFFWVMGGLEPIPPDLGWKAGYTQDWSTVNHRAHKETTIHIYIGIYGQFRVFNQANMQIFQMGMEPGVSGEHAQREIQTQIFRTFWLGGRRAKHSPHCRNTITWQMSQD